MVCRLSVRFYACSVFVGCYELLVERVFSVLCAVSALCNACLVSPVWQVVIMFVSSGYVGSCEHCLRYVFSLNHFGWDIDCCGVSLLLLACCDYSL